MALKTFTAELPKALIPFAIACSKKQQKDNYKILEIVESDLSKSNKNKQVQALGYNKRHSQSLLVDIEGKRDSAVECRENHIEILEAKITSAQKQIKKWQRQLEKLKYPCCDVKRNQFKSKQHRLRFNIHYKKRYIVSIQDKLNKTKNSQLKVNLGTPYNFMFLGSKGETKGNSNCQYDESKNQIKIRVTPDLEEQFGKYVTADLIFKYGQDCLVAALMRRSINSKTGEIYRPGKGEALTWRIYRKNHRWYISFTVDVTSVPTQSKPARYGCIGVDINPGVVGWCYVDTNGNAIEWGQFKTNLHSRTSGQVEASLVFVSARLVEIASKYACPIVIERLDFSGKKNKMREQGKFYARMLSSFAYSTFKEVLLKRCQNIGIQLIQVNPAYSSLIGLTKFMARFGMGSDTAAGMVIARRAMKLKESVPGHVALKVGVDTFTRRHVWSTWRRLSRKLKGVRRHNFFKMSLTANSSDIFVGTVAVPARLDDQQSSVNRSD